MKVSACVCLVLAALCTPSFASRTTSKRVKAQQATILRVDKTEPAQEFTGGDNPSDAPLRSESYDYRVTLRVGCGTYVGQYESAYDYLPSSIAPSNKVNVKLQGHFMDVDSGSEELHMPIVHRQIDREPNCSSK